MSRIYCPKCEHLFYYEDYHNKCPKCGFDYDLVIMEKTREYFRILPDSKPAA